MIELETQKYSLAEEPLKRVSINTLFARAVIEKKVSGKVFVDDNTKPKTFYVIHPYGMSLLFGEATNESFNKQFLDYCLNKTGERAAVEWMQACPDTWDETLRRLFGNKLVSFSDNKEVPQELIELDTRVNFRFNREKYQAFKTNNVKKAYSIIRTNKDCYNQMRGSVVPAHFWDSAEDFCQNGVGFSLFCGDKLATTAYSAFIFDKELELGMETVPEYRGKGFALHACSALIDYCLLNNYEPIWACKLTNTPSYKLAQKLGFVPGCTLPYYRLAL